MKKNLLVIGAVLGVALFLFAFTTNTRKNDPTEDKVTICHYPPNDAAGIPMTIEVNRNAVDGHLGHGDTEGECPCVCD